MEGGGNYRKRGEGGREEENDLWEGKQDTEASLSVLWKKSQGGTTSPGVRGGVFHLPPCQEVCNGSARLSDCEISQLQSKHTSINTHRKTHKSFSSSTCLQSFCL